MINDISAGWCRLHCYEVLFLHLHHLVFEGQLNVNDQCMDGHGRQYSMQCETLHTLRFDVQSFALKSLILAELFFAILMLSQLIYVLANLCVHNFFFLRTSFGLFSLDHKTQLCN